MLCYQTPVRLSIRRLFKSLFAPCIRRLAYIAGSATLPVIVHRSTHGGMKGILAMSITSLTIYTIQCSYLEWVSPELLTNSGRQVRKKEPVEALSMDPAPAFYASLLKACGVARNLSEGEHLHDLIDESEHSQNRYLQNLLVEMYAKCGNLQRARHVFDEIPQWNVFSWTIMIRAYIDYGDLEEARRMFDRMPLWDVVPWTDMIAAYAQKGHLQEAECMFYKIPERNVVSCNAMMAMYAWNGHVQKTRTLFEEMPHRDLVSWNTMVAAYAQNGHLQEARSLFDIMLERNVVAWNTMIFAYAQNGHGKEAIALFQEMDADSVSPDKVTFLAVLEACAKSTALAEGKIFHNRCKCNGFESDVVIGNSLINMYGKCGNLGEAWRVLQRMIRRDVVSWTAMISALSRCGHCREAMELFQRMNVEGIQPDEITFMGILSGCSHGGLLTDGLRCFASLKEDYGVVPSLDYYDCIIDLLGRAGRLQEVEELVNSMPFEPDVVAWMSLLDACRNHGNAERGAKAVERVAELKALPPYVLLSNTPN